MNRAEQLNFVKSLNLTAGQVQRMDCPVCGGQNTFGAERERGVLRWNCFRASCSARGITDTALSASDIRHALYSEATIGDDERSWEVPSYFTSVALHDKALRFLDQTHSYRAYANRMADIRYDPKRDRVVFMVRDRLTGLIVDGAGRSLCGETPKWLRYANSSIPFMCGTSEIGVIVEDAPSACAVSEVATGVAVLGTNVLDASLSQLRTFKRVIVALDKDASRKANDIAKTLDWFVPTSVALLDDDLKYFDTEGVKDRLCLTG